MMNPAEFANIAQAEDSLWWYVGMREITLRLLGRELRCPPRRMLDAGGGTGAFASRLADEFQCSVDAADIASEGLKLARARGLDSLVQADTGKLPFSSDTYDCVFSLDVLVYFAPDDEHAAMAELTRVVRPGGLVMVRVAALEALRSRHSAYTRERQRFTRTRLLRVARASGLEVIRCTYLNSLLLPVALLKFRVWEPLLRKPPASGVQPIPGWLNSALRLVLQFESWWISRGFGFLAGQSLLLLARKPA